MEGGGASTEEDNKEAVLQELHSGNHALEVENQLLETYLQRVCPSGTSGGEENEEPKLKRKGTKKKGMEAVDRIDRPLTMEEKYDIACSEIDVLKEEMERVKSESEHMLDDLRALMEEAEIRMAETKKETYEFKRDVVVGAENFRTGKTMAEKMLRYMEEKLRGKDANIEKLRLKNSTLKSQIAKAEGALAQREEMGEVLHVVDFDQLKIQNQQYLEKIEDRNNELLRLKLTTARTVQVLNQLKRKLSTLAWQSEWLQKSINEKREQLKKYEQETAKLSEEKGVAERQHKVLKAQQDDTELPAMMDYIKVKAEVVELEKKSCDWERKVEIAEMEAKRTRRTVASMGSFGTVRLNSPNGIRG